MSSHPPRGFLENTRRVLYAEPLREDA